jgi:single stranded DNA-binding protein
MNLLFNKTFCDLTLQARVGGDIELRTSSKGNIYTVFSVAYNININKDGAWQEETKWVRIALFGKTAENTAKYISKGDLVLIKGSISYEKIAEDKADWKINVRSITPITTNKNNKTISMSSTKSEQTKNSEEFEDDALESIHWDI